MNERDLKQSRAYRAEDFRVEVGLLKDQFLYSDELFISVTHNGSQWQVIEVTPAEARTLIDKLQEYLDKTAAPPSP